MDAQTDTFKFPALTEMRNTLEGTGQYPPNITASMYKSHRKVEAWVNNGGKDWALILPAIIKMTLIIAKRFNLPVSVSFQLNGKSCSAWRSPGNWWGPHQIWFSLELVGHYYNNGYKEYASLNSFIEGHIPNYRKYRTLAAVSMLVAHELAHVMVYERYGARSDREIAPHGAEYRWEYAKILKILAAIIREFELESGG